LAQISNGNEDLRVRRTRKMLQTALIELTIQKGFGSVTIRDLCEHAMVNRATFYRHYIDKYALLEEYMESIYQLVDLTQGADVTGHPDEPPAGLVRLLEHLRSHANFYRVMLGSKGYPLFGERIRQYIEKRLRYSLLDDQRSMESGQPPADMILHSISSASLGAILWWLEKDMPFPPEQMALWAVKLSRTLLEGEQAVW
jgi:AcrR family transcriptional regulator